MSNVAVSALQSEDEPELQEALIELNEIAEVEPKFFRKYFKELFDSLECVVVKNDYVNLAIRHQPIELAVTIVDRIPSVLKKNEDYLKKLLDYIFKLMIDIDSDIDAQWLTPKEGYRVADDDTDDDSVYFGKQCIDRLVGSLGEERMLPLLATLVQNVIQNEEDWRFKNAALMAFS